MPLQKLQFRPGVNREGTTLANEGGWFESDKIRFRSGYPEKIGGWIADTGRPNEALLPPALATPAPTGYAYNTPSYWGVCRSMWNWITLGGQNLLGLGTNLKYYIQNGVNGTFYDITPERVTNTAVTNAFTTTYPANASIITVTDPGHGAQTGDFVTIVYAGGAIGGVPRTAIDGEHQITYVNSNQYTITVSSPATSAAGPTGTATFIYQINTGLDVYTVTAGWGAGTWGGFVFGTTVNYVSTALIGNTLSANISASATTINVTSTTGFASPTGSIWIGQELITYTGTTGTSFTGCTRGTGGTTAAFHFTGMAVVANTTSIVLTSTTGFTAPGVIAIDSELIYYTTNTTGSNTLSGCVRGYSGSTPAAHAVSSVVTQVTNNFSGWGIAASTGVGTQLRLWSEANYGQDLIINPRGGALYYWATDANPNVFNRAELLGPGATVATQYGNVTVDAYCPSVANLVMVSDASRFVIAFGCNNVLDPNVPLQQNPLFIAWSAQEQFNIWDPTDITQQAGTYQLSSGSEIVAAQQTRQEILVFTDAAVYSMQYLGPPYVWGFQIMGDNISIAGPNVVSTANNVTYWMGTDKFYMYSGRVETLPCALRQYVFDDINMDQAYQFFSSTNEGYNEVWWFYCSANSTEIDRYVVFNHLERTWYYGTGESVVPQGTNRYALARTAWLDSPLRAQPMSAGYGGQLLYQETGNNDGTTNPPLPIESYVQSSDFDIGDGHNFGMVWRIIPDVTFDGSDTTVAGTSPYPSVVFTVRPRQNPGANYGSTDTPEVTSTQNYSPPPVGQQTYNVQQFTEYAYVRVRGRQMAFKISSDALGVAWQLGAPRLDVRPDGRR
jgi:hypothetical protein